MKLLGLFDNLGFVFFIDNFKILICFLGDGLLFIKRDDWWLFLFVFSNLFCFRVLYLLFLGILFDIILEFFLLILYLLDFLLIFLGFCFLIWL